MAKRTFAVMFKITKWKFKEIEAENWHEADKIADDLLGCDDETELGDDNGCECEIEYLRETTNEGQ